MNLSQKETFHNEMIRLHDSLIIRTTTHPTVYKETQTATINEVFRTVLETSHRRNIGRIRIA